MEATPRATSRARGNREKLIVTRHGLCSAHAATLPLRSMAQCTPFAKIAAGKTNISSSQHPYHGSSRQKSQLPSRRNAPQRGGVAITTDRQNPKSP
jgi:hypothetical protein